MNKAVTGPVSYTVLVGKTVRKGTAKIVLELIRREAAKDAKEVADMNIDEYADALVGDASYFVAEDVLKELEKQSYPSKYDKALIYLAAMPSSHVTILPPRFLGPAHNP